MVMQTQTDLDQLDIDPFHVLMPSDHHKRLRLVCSMLGTTMSAFIRPLVIAEVDRRWTELGLDGIRPDGGKLPPQRLAKAK
jgi:hypothetical protein